MEATNSHIKLFADIKDGKVGILTNTSIHDKIPFRLLLNTVLCAQFDLKPNFCAEGGIQGHEVRLINDSDFAIGLSKDPGLGRGVSTNEKKILLWYNELLKIFFIKGSLGKILPEFLWVEQKYKDRYDIRSQLLADAVIHSDWRVFGNCCDVDEKFHFYYEIFLRKKLKEFLTETLGAEEFLPFIERNQFALWKNPSHNHIVF